MRDLKKEFENRTIHDEKLKDYGFDKNGIYETQIGSKEFKVIVELTKEKQVSKVIDIESKEEYTLVDIEDAVGNFVGHIRKEYEEVLNDIIEKCTTLNTFHQKQSLEIIQYVKETYHDELEFLWKSYPDNAIWRNQKNGKWYAALLTIAERKLGMDSDKMVEIIDLRYPKEEINKIIDGKVVYPGYHMNKKSWITIPLDDSMKTEDIIELLDISYKISFTK